MTEVTVIKFCTRVGHIKPVVWDDIYFLVGVVGVTWSLEILENKR